MKTVKKKSQRKQPKTPAQRAKGSRGPASKYRPTMPLQAYRMLKSGLTVEELLQEWKISRSLLYNCWREQYPELREAMELAEKERLEDRSFPEYIYRRLRPELRELWDKIKTFSRERDATVKIETLLLDSGKRVRQELFLHALCMLNFNPSAALSKVSVTKRELDRWIIEDSGFAELVQEIEWHKANFYESALVQLVKEGNPAAVIHANKTFNKERGYAPKSELSVSGQVDINNKLMVGVLDLTDLMPFMSEPIKLGVLEAIRQKEIEDKKQEGKLLGGPVRVFDAEAKVGEQILQAAGESEV